MAGTNVHPSSPNLMSDASGVAEAQRAMDEGMRLFAERQAPAYDPMGGAEARPAESTLQPRLVPEPGDGEGGVT
jgi:hypothetical protein